MPLGQAFEVLSRNADRRVGSCLKALLASLQASENIGESFRGAGFSQSDAAIIQAGEASGRLDAVFVELAEFYAQLGQARRTVVAKSIYPVLVLHLAAILLAIPPALLDGGWTTFFAQSLPILLGFYLCILLGAVLWRIARSLLSRSSTSATVIVRIPVARTLSSQLDSLEVFVRSFALYCSGRKSPAGIRDGRNSLRECCPPSEHDRRARACQAR